MGVGEQAPAAEQAATVSVRVPATSANLGPGFDSLGLALGWYDEVRARRTDGATTVTVRGQGAGELPTGEEHLVVRAMNDACREWGIAPEPVALWCDNHIPQARGLGSSSAAIVAGVLLARALFAQGASGVSASGVSTSGAPAGASGGAEMWPDDRAVLRLAARLEGHPDNVAPCLLGGFTIAWTEPEQGARAVRLLPDAGLRPTVFVPAERGYTKSARAALPPRVPHEDAAHAVSRAALLVTALTSVPELLPAATEDRLHQDYRAASAPETTALVARLRAADVPAVISGAGPSVLALGPVPQELAVQPGWSVHEREVDTGGARVTSGLGSTYTEQEQMTRRPGPVLPQVGQVV